MKKILLLSITSVLVTTLIFSGCTGNETGTLVLQITDDTGLNITHANVTISHVYVHKNAADINDTTGEWLTVVNESQMFDLIEITDAKEFFGSAVLGAGIYTQIRLMIDSCVITVNGTEYECHVPSDSIKLVKQFVLLPDQTTTLTLDFDVNESVMQRGVHEYIFQPVIKVIQE